MAKLSISGQFLPPDLGEAGNQRAFKRMFADRSGLDPVFKLNVTLFGKVGMVICWYYDRSMEGMEDFRTAARLVRLLPHLLAGRLHKLGTGDLYYYCDAIGSFPKRGEKNGERHRLFDRLKAEVAA